MSEKSRKELVLDIRDGMLHGFGRFNGKPMDWVILDEEKDTPDERTLVFYRTPVGQKARGITVSEDEFGTEYEWTNIWDKSFAYSWLNNDFLKESFTEEEQEHMVHDLHRGRLFALCQEDVVKYFPSAKDRAFGTTWWLRDRDYVQDGRYVHADGICVEEDGGFSSRSGTKELSILPAMWVSRFTGEALKARIGEWEMRLNKQLEELAARRNELLDHLPDNLSDAEREQWDKLKADIENAEKDLAAKKNAPILREFDAKRKRILQERSDHYHELEEWKKTLEKLNQHFFRFGEKKEAKARIREFQEKRDEAEAQWQALYRENNAANDAVRKAEKDLEQAQVIFDEFYKGIFDGELQRIGQQIAEIEDMVRAMKEEHGLE